MPAIILFLILVGIAGGFKVPNNTQSDDGSSGFSVSAQFTNPETNTGIIPGGVVSGLNQSSQNTVSAISNSPVDTTVFSIDIESAINIDFNRVSLKGSVVIPKSYSAGLLFFAYSTNQADLILNTQVTKTYDEVYNNTNVKTSLISKATKNSNTYTRNISSLEDGEKYYFRMCFEIPESALYCSLILSFETVENIYRSTYYSVPTVSTQRAENIQGYSATIKGNYRLNSAENATAFFVYGESQSLVDSIPADYDTYADVIEARENLQKIRMGAQAKSTDSPERQIDDLERDTKYYYRLCVAYDDKNATEIRCGRTLSFTTDTKDRNIPLVRSSQVVVSGIVAALSATIDMQDYNSGHVFLVYGTNENSIERVSSIKRFTQVSQNGNSIQRVSLNIDFDGRNTLTKNITHLLNLSTYYYRFCVEYEALDDYNRETFFLSCGDTNSFTTN